MLLYIATIIIFLFSSQRTRRLYFNAWILLQTVQCSCWQFSITRELRWTPLFSSP